MQQLPTAVLDWMRVATHVHSHFPANTSCCGTQAVREIALLASQLGLAGVAFAEHTSNPSNPHYVVEQASFTYAMDEWLRRFDEDNVDSEVRLFPGFEYNIMPLGDLDVLCTEFGRHVVTASQHGGLGPDEKNPKAIVRRLTKAASLHRVDIIGHPTRYNDEVVGVPWDEICEFCFFTNTAIELNFNLWFTKGPGQVEQPAWNDDARAWFRRANDFWYEWLETVAASGVFVTIGLDIHNPGMWPMEPPAEVWSPTVAKLQEFLRLIQVAGIQHRRVINASLRAFETFVGTDKDRRGSIL